MSSVALPRALDAVSDDECRDLLAGAEVGRVIVSIDALPAAFPVNYRLIDDVVVFRTAPGTKLTAALNHTVVGFEIDDFDPAEIARLDRVGLRSWAPLPAPRYVQISIQRISGRRLSSAVTNAGPARA